MHSEPLPYAMESGAFPLPGVAALAGRLPLGGGREVALAALLIGRLAQALLLPDPLPPTERASRAAAAKGWLASLALPAVTRVPFTRALEATTGTPLQLAGALRALVTAAGGHLDAAAVREVEQLARRLAAS